MTTFGGEHVSCTRNSLRKISKTRYLAICNCIAEISRADQATGNSVSDNIELTTSKDSSVDGLSDHTPNNSPPAPQNDKDSDRLCLEKLSSISVCQDMATSTDVLETVERGTLVSVPTQEQAVGTGPQMVDHSTTTDSNELTVHPDTEGSSRDTVDYSSPPPPPPG